jgi:hypothetical protein
MSRMPRATTSAGSVTWLINSTRQWKEAETSRPASRSVNTRRCSVVSTMNIPW